MGEYLEEIVESSKKSQKKTDVPRCNEKITKLKFDSNFNSVLYFIYKFKFLSKGLPESGQKYHLKKILSKRDQLLIGDLDILNVQSIFERMYIEFDNSNQIYVKELESLELTQCESLSSFFEIFFFIT